MSSETTTETPVEQLEVLIQRRLLPPDRWFLLASRDRQKTSVNEGKSRGP